MAKHLVFKGCMVAPSSDLGGLIAAGETKKAEALYRSIDAEFQEVWKDHKHLMNFKIGEKFGDKTQPRKDTDDGED